MERTGRQYQDGASPPPLWTQCVPTLPAQRQVHGLQPHEAFDAAFENPECVKMILEWDRESESDSERGKA